MTMDEHIFNFPAQLVEAIQIARLAQLKKKNVDAVLISGLGGSGIGGSLAQDCFASESRVPILVNKDYSIPSFVNSNTLVIISSYSGNTEETISAYEKAKSKGACIVAISSGGKILKDAIEDNFQFITLPGGNPPRTCLGYSFVQVVAILEAFDVIPKGNLAKIASSSEYLVSERESIQLTAKFFAEKLYKKIPVIYGLSNTEALALRFRQQLNENSKMLCWHHVFPEMNHNELVGWTNKNDSLSVIILRTDYDHSRVVKRVEICKDIFEKYCSEVLEIKAKGKSFMEQALYLVHLTDWISWYLAELNLVDAMEVNVIDFLKNELSKS